MHIELKPIIEEDLLSGYNKLLSQSHKIAITCHMSPDGDAIGSTLAMSLFLQAQGKETTVLSPDKVPEDMAFLPDFEKIVTYTQIPEEANKIIADADLIICLDYNGLNRIAKMRDSIQNASCPKIMIDHHLYPENFCDVTISYPEMTSACELLFRLLHQTGNEGKIDTQIAECIYTGMMTDTGNFSYNSNKAELYLIVAALVEKGIDKDRIYKLTMRTIAENRLRLTGYAISKKMVLYPECHASLIVLDKRDLGKFNYQAGDTETLANMPLAIPEVNWSTFFRQEKGYIKVSMRSEGDFAVNTLCQSFFNGGGHANAAGGEFHGSLADAIKTYHQVLEFVKAQNIKQ